MTGFFTIAIVAGLALSLEAIIALTILVIFTFAYAYDKNFRNSVNSLFNNLYQCLATGFDYLFNVILDCFDKVKSSNFYSGEDVHHIVAKNDPRADIARCLIVHNCLKVDDPFNLVKIKKTFHLHLHTNSYFAAVNLILLMCVVKKKTKSDKKNAIISAVTMIGSFLKAASDLLI